MFISKKRFKQMEKRIADLEGQVQSQQANNIKIKLDDLLDAVSSGKITLNQARELFGLLQIPDTSANILVVKG